MAIRKLIIDDSMGFREGPDGISMAGYFFSISASRSQVLNRSFDGVEMSHSGLDRRSSFGPDHTGAVEGSFRDSADFVEKFPDFNFQLSPTFLQAIHDIRLDACTVHFHQVLEKLPGLTFDYTESLHGCEEHVG
jgi:hypothetical protein